MKKLLALGVAAALFPAVAFARNNYPMAGCGLIYAAGLRDNTKFPQVVASIFNGVLGSQTFGITSGTSGCNEAGTLMMKSSVETEVYAEVNYKQLQREMAAGSGEYLNGFASLLGVKDDQRPAFFRLMQDQHAAIFPADGASTQQMLGAVMGALSAHPEILA